MKISYTILAVFQLMNAKAANNFIANLDYLFTSVNATVCETFYMSCDVKMRETNAEILIDHGTTDVNKEVNPMLLER
jgi:hypothetical protein